MRTITQTHFLRHINAVLDSLTDGPITITRRGKESAVIILRSQWDAMQAELAKLEARTQAGVEPAP